MRIVLEYEDFRWAESLTDETVKLKWLIVRVGGKEFYVQRMLKNHYPLGMRGIQDDEVDRTLIDHMQHILEYLLLKGAAEVSDGIIPVRCESDSAWRTHFEGKCMCKKVGIEP